MSYLKILIVFYIENKTFIHIQDIVLSHVRNVYLGRRNFHYLMSGLVLDDAWVPDEAEYYAVNITGLRLVSPEKRKVKKILNEWKKLDKKKYKVIHVIFVINLIALLISSWIITIYVLESFFLLA